MKLFIDDVRNPEPGDTSWIVIRRYEYAVKIISEFWYDITEISLDHDLGTAETGYDIACKIEEIAHDTHYTYLPTIKCHSMNPVGRDKILKVVAKLESRFKEDI